MGFFDNDESSTSVSTTNTQTTTLVPSSGAEGGALSIASVGNVDYQALDAGAIGDAFQFAGEGVSKSLDFLQKESASSFEKFFKFASESLGLVEKTISAGQALQQQEFDKVLTFADKSATATTAAIGESQSGGAQRLLYLGAAALLVFAFIARKGL